MALKPIEPDGLTVLIDGQPIGTVTVLEQTPRKLFGWFTPGPRFEPYRPIFEASVELSRQFDATTLFELGDDAIWERLIAAYADIQRLGPEFAELVSPIEEFAVEADWSIEVTFDTTRPRPHRTNLEAR